MIRQTRTELSAITSIGESGFGPLSIEIRARGAGGGKNGWLLLEKITASERVRCGEPRREDLGDHAAHRGADDVGAVDAEVIEYRGGVVGHVFQPVVRVAGHSQPELEHVGDQRAARLAPLRLAGQADVAVVVADHP